MINTLKDNLMLAKESLKSRLVTTPRPELADRLIKHLGLRNVERVIAGKPNTLIILTKAAVVKMPLDSMSEDRCNVNNEMLKKLTSTSIAAFVPRSIDAGVFEDKEFYVESRLPGTAIDLPLSNIDDMVEKAADFVTRFHRETVKDIKIDETWFDRLIGKDIYKLSLYLSEEYKAKLAQIEIGLKKELLGKQFKTVWFHGDYKIENVLFDMKTWEIKGVIDWDLSCKDGLPLLDVLYLSVYKSGLMEKKSFSDVLQGWLSNPELICSDKEVSAYLRLVDLDNVFIRPMLIAFWLHHVTQRYFAMFTYRKLKNDTWVSNHVCRIIDNIALGI